MFFVEGPPTTGATLLALVVVSVQLVQALHTVPSNTCTHSVSEPACAPPTYCVAARSLAATSILVCAVLVAPLTVKWPPAAPPSKNRYVAIASPSASLVPNSVEALTALPCTTVCVLLVGVATGARFGGRDTKSTVFHALHAPWSSCARISIVSVPLFAPPFTQLELRFEAFTTTSAPCACSAPLVQTRALPAAALSSLISNLTIGSLSPSLTVMKSDSSE